MVAGLLAAAMLTAPAGAAPASQAKTASQAGQLAGRGPAATGISTGGVTGTVRGLSRSPVSRACVTAVPEPAPLTRPAGPGAANPGAANPGTTGPAAAGVAAAGAAGPAGLPGDPAVAGLTAARSGSAGLAGTAIRRARSATTAPGGRFLLGGLRPGRYLLQYRNCGLAVTGVPQLRRPGAPLATSQVLVSSGRVSVAGPVTLRPASLLARLAGATPGWLLSHATADTVPATARTGRVAGTVTSKAGRPLAGICVYEISGATGKAYRSSTNARGRYLGKAVRPGKYYVAFAPGCGNHGNWLVEFYRNTTSPYRARTVKIAAGHTIRGISAVLRLGGEITGTVTNLAGTKLSGICVAVMQGASGPPGLVAPIATHDGSYQVHSLPPGRYKVLFTNGCPSQANYAPQWWQDKAPNATPTSIKITAGRVASHINARLQPGAEISGTVTASTATGTPLPGICVSINGEGSLQDFGEGVVTGKGGHYLATALSTGNWQVVFFPGCGGNGNYLSASVTTAATDGQVATANGILPIGGVLTGTVLGHGGTPAGGICVSVFGNDGTIEFAATGSSGTYRVDQLPTSQYAINFSGGCGNAGSYAPQFYPGEISQAAASMVTVTAGSTTAGIGAQLLPGGTIAGRVTSSSGRGLSGVCVQALPASFYGSFAQATIVNGRYSLPDLLPGLYQVVFIDCRGGDLAAQAFRSRPGQYGGQLISVNPGVTTNGISAVMRPGGTITGLVTSRSGRPLSLICVQAVNLSDGTVTAADDLVTQDGRYRISALAAGRYRVEFYPCGPGNFVTSWYRHASRYGAATTVVVRSGRTTKSIDGVLAAGGKITGILTERATGQPVRNVCAEAVSTDHSGFIQAAVTGKTGHYVVNDLNTGAYEVAAVSCLSVGANLADQVRAGTVRVTAGKTRSGINMALTAGGSVSGAVSAGSPAVPEDQMCVDIEPTAAKEMAGFGFTGAGGEFTATNLLPGTYRVLSGDPGCGLGFAPQWYNNQPTRATATLVTVQAGQTTDLVRATLASDGQVSGTVTGPAPGHARLTGACVTAVPIGSGFAGPSPGQAGLPAVTAVTRNGAYTILDLTPGHYRVEFGSGCGVSGYATQWWRNASSKARATIISVAANSLVTGINAALRR